MRIDADYLVVGAGASGMAFTDALVDHGDARVVLVDRRSAPGGHWRDAYPFVRLHQASAFYGVASTVLGTGAIQQDGPERGLHERAGAPEICAYYDRVLHERLLPGGRVELLSRCEYHRAGRITSLDGDAERTVAPATRVVDARYLAPEIPATSPPPFAVADGARVVAVGELPEHRASEYVVVGSGKTATDACIWLLEQGVDPDAICWVRPREPWMMSRAVVQPDPAVFLSMAADVMESAIAAATPDELFLRLEAAGVMLRIDPSRTPTMARAPTLGGWELDLLRTLGRVVRLGHVRAAEPGRLVLEGGDLPLERDAVVVHCAAAGLRQPPLVPIWGEDAITLQPVRSGFPCLAAALVGYVEATRGDDGEKNRICPPSPFSSTPADWALMQALGGRAAQAFGAEPDIKAWVDGLVLNPARSGPDVTSEPAVAAALDRFRAAAEPGLGALARLGAPARPGV